MAFLSVGLSFLSLHSDFSSGGAVFQVESSAKSCHVSRHFRLESHRVKSGSSLSEKMVSVRKLGCPSYNVRLSSCPSLFLPFVRFSIQSGPNREELRSHGWIEGKECYLRVSPRGFVGDCVTATISWHEAIVLGLCGLFFFIITIFLIYKGNLSSSVIPFFENRRKKNNKNRFVPTSIYPNAPPHFLFTGWRYCNARNALRLVMRRAARPGPPNVQNIAPPGVPLVQAAPNVNANAGMSVLWSNRVSLASVRS